MPVFAGEEIVAFTANIAHWNDVGGIVPGSMSNESREIFQEGLRLPAVKLIARGARSARYSRSSRSTAGCRISWRATCGRGSPRSDSASGGSGSSSSRYGKATFVAAVAQFMAYGEQVSRQALQGLPKGRFSLEEEQDDGVVYRVSIEITDDEFVVDLRDNPEQDSGPNNALPRRRDDRRPDDLQERHRPGGRRQRRTLSRRFA